MRPKTKRIFSENNYFQRVEVLKRNREKRNKYRTTMMSNWDEMTQKAKEVIVKSVPNWDSVSGQVAQYALNEGFPFEHITGHDRQTRERVGPGVVDPVFARTLYKAMQWDKLQASKATVTGKVANAPPVVKPGAPSNIQTANKHKWLQSHLLLVINQYQNARVWHIHVK